MKRVSVRLLNEFIRQELIVSEFYSLFKEKSDEYRELWNQLMEEEINHADLLRSEIDCFYKLGLMLNDLIALNLESLKKQNSSLTNLLTELKISQISQKKMFSIAMDLERDVIEKSYQPTIDQTPNSRPLKIFHSIKESEKNHLKIISQHASQKTIHINRSDIPPHDQAILL